MKALLVIGAGLLIFFNAWSLAEASKETKEKPESVVSQEEARQIVFAVLKETTKWTTLPGFFLDRFNDPYFPNYYFFEALWDNPDGSVHLGSYPVNPKTADVWDVSGCEKLEPNSIASLQKSLRKRLGLTSAEYKKWSAKPPCGK